MLSVASRKLVKLLLAYVEEIVMEVLEGKRCHKMTENTYPLANTSFLPRTVLQYSHGVGMLLSPNVGLKQLGAQAGVFGPSASECS